ncbi:MAG: HAD family hydrolase [Bacteroidia bacterium]|nr:HAD family hydrolase [Bacteroidia bacterium]
MNKALFLDRDGVINQEIGDYVWTPEKVVFVEGLFTLLSIIQKRGWKIIVITNQGGIDKGIYSRLDVIQLHAWINQQFQNSGMMPVEWYFCAHHPSISNCLCRKPQTLLFEKAIHKHQIQATLSWMIGDRDRDLEPAKKLGMKTILVGNEQSENADFRVQSLLEIPVILGS